MAAGGHRARLVYLVHASAQDLAENLHGHVLDREAAYVQGGDGPPAHGVDVTQGVGGRYLPEKIGVVHYGREKIQGEDDGYVVGKFVYSGVVGGIAAHQQVGVPRHGQPLEDLGQVARTYLGGSAGCPGLFGQFGFLGHVSGTLLTINVRQDRALRLPGVAPI